VYYKIKKLKSFSSQIQNTIKTDLILKKCMVPRFHLEQVKWIHQFGSEFTVL